MKKRVPSPPRRPCHATVWTNLVHVFVVRHRFAKGHHRRFPTRHRHRIDRSGEFCVYHLIAFSLRRREWRNKHMNNHKTCQSHNLPYSPPCENKRALWMYGSCVRSPEEADSDCGLRMARPDGDYQVSTLQFTSPERDVIFLCLPSMSSSLSVFSCFPLVRPSV